MIGAMASWNETTSSLQFQTMRLWSHRTPTNTFILDLPRVTDMVRYCCSSKFEAPISSKSTFISDLLTHFYSHRVKDCTPEGYIGSDTTRVYSLNPKGASSLTRVVDVFRDKGFIRNFTDAFDLWYSKNPMPRRADYDLFHQTEVQRFYDELLRLGIYKRIGDKKGGPPGKLGDYYNSFAKPYNLLIWHHAYGSDKGRIPPYSKTSDGDLSLCLHPAMDSYVFDGMRDVLATLSTPTVKIPRNGFTYLRKKTDYDGLIAYLRGINDDILIFEGFWG